MKRGLIGIRISLIFAVVFCFSTTQINAQSFFIRNPLQSMGASPKFSISAESYFNSKDVYFDFGIGVDDIGYDYSARLNFGFRPYTKTVISEIAEKEFMQYWERSYIISLDLEKRFNFMVFGDDNRFGPYVASKVGFFLADYRGVSKHPSSGFKLIPSTGLNLKINHSSFSVGYLFLNNGSDELHHMLQLKYAFTFFNEE